MNGTEYSLMLDDTKLSLKIGGMAPSADVSVFAQMGETCVLATIVVGNKRDDIDYLPLYVEYAEKLYAGGRIKGSRWVKREGRPSDEAVLIRRLIDRGIRPLFPKSYRREVQIVITLLSIDGVNSPDILSAIAASAAVRLSQAPWKGPLSSVRVAHVPGSEGESANFIVNPTEHEQSLSTLDLIVTSTAEKVVMIETQAQELDEKIILDGIKEGKAINKKIIDFIEEINAKEGKPKEEEGGPDATKELAALLSKEYASDIEALAAAKGKKEGGRDTVFDAFIEKVLAKHGDTYEKRQIVGATTEVIHAAIRNDILTAKKRVDGRKIDEIRPLSAHTSILPRTHGSAIFERGQTQVLSIATLGSPSLEQLIEGPEGQEAKRYLHHYYMPPYSVGEVGRMFGPGPREIGHGALAEKAIEPVLPSASEFPYTIRVVSEVLSSNGSTSMASTCGSSLALMDAGVPIRDAVAGISIGLVWESDSNYVLLTDIAGVEDFAGHMDFKVAGTKKGITAIQLDVKNNGLTDGMIEETLAKAKVARDQILEVMNAQIASSRGEVSEYAPKVVVLTPPEDKIGEIIGPGGKNIRSIIAQTQTDIQVTDDGRVSITGIDKAAVERATELVKNVYRQVQIGETFEGEVKRILAFGAFVEFLPGKEGLVHVSKMGKGFVKDPHDVVAIGDKVQIRVDQVDPQGRINLSMIPQTNQEAQ